MTTYDFIVIGGGRAGFAALRPVAAAGKRTAMIDSGPIGGLCALRGCNPKKVLVRSSEALAAVREAERFGVDVAGVTVDWSRVIDRKNGFTAGVTELSERMLRDMGTELIQGSPRFIGPNTVLVAGRELGASGFVVATGSVPRPLTFEGAEHVRTTDDILDLRTVPEHLVCVGAGVVAFELGHVFARLGSRVTILARESRALAGNEPELTAALIAYSREIGVEVVFETSIMAVRIEGERAVVIGVRDGIETRYEADFILNAAGRVAAVDGLDLDAAGVAVEPHGVAVTEFLRSTTNPAVFAAGDAHGRLQLSPNATYEGDLIGTNFLHGDTLRADYTVVPRAIYTTPQFASVGITEAEARKQGLNVRAVASDMTEWTVFAIAGEPLAQAKVVIDAGTDRILGAHILGPAAAELIHLFAMAMRFNATAADLAAMQYAYPTFASAVPSMVA